MNNDNTNLVATPLSAEREPEYDVAISALTTLHDKFSDALTGDDWARLRELIEQRLENPSAEERGLFDFSPVLFDLQTALICAEEIGPNRAALLGILLRNTPEQAASFGDDVARIVRGISRVNQLYSRSPSIETENFRDLLLSFAEDMRVIFVIIADRVNLMRQIKDRGTDADRRQVATEASHLYAPLAHKLGLYLIKSELEDLSLKYLEHDAYYMIKDKLNETKRSRDRYIANFIGPVEEKLQQAGLHFHIKGRTKSIHSIWQKMQKQRCGFENIYDLFAIRVILDSEPEREKQDCWQVFSIVTDMYRPNPKRLRDWLSVPKSNGYESLHITVMGPEGKWVEVQIRSERMDQVAERGLAAHWRYKGVKDSGTRLEEMLTDIRTALESGNATDQQLVDQFKVDLYSDEVFVFTPRGDLFKMPKGATVLDFAYRIHTNVGSHCTGGRINGKNAPIRTQLKSGDQVEILTSPNQTPRRDWLTAVITAKARSKIRQQLTELELRTTTIAKETLERRMKNRKVEYDEAKMMRLLKRLGYKHVSQFYSEISDGKLDVNQFIDKYIGEDHNSQTSARENASSADEYMLHGPSATDKSGESTSSDVLVIDKNIKGVQYSMARCCNPIYGDKVFGFVTAGRGIKIHRDDCPNALRLKEQMPYRVIAARWAGKGGSLYPVTLHIVGHDDIGIVNNITSIITKEQNVMLRSIDIKSSEDGLFAGTLTIQLDDVGKLKLLQKKLQAVKGVKNVSR